MVDVADDDSTSSHRALELSFDRRLVDDRPYLLDLAFPKFVENILGEANSPPVDLEAQERSLRHAIEAQPARNIRWVGNQQLDLEMKVRNLRKVLLKHLAIARQSDPPAVVVDLITNELF